MLGTPSIAEIAKIQPATNYTDKAKRIDVLGLLTLPALVLTGPFRNGRRHALRHETETRRRCMDWISGIRADLWSPGSGRRGKPRKKPDHNPIPGALPDPVVFRVASRFEEGSPPSGVCCLATGPSGKPHGRCGLGTLPSSPRSTGQ